MADDNAKGGRGISGGLIGGATALATAIAAIVGMLNQLGYIGNHATSKPAAVVASAPLNSEPAIAPGSSISDEARSDAGAAPSSALAMTEPGKLSSLTGAWRDAGMGACHLITQHGSDLEITNYFPDSNEVMSHGDGTVTGSQVEFRLRTMHGHFRISPDGKVLQGTMLRATGTRRSMWQYIGTSCRKPG